MGAHKMGLKQPQNEAKLNPKPTQKIRGIKPKCSTRGDDTYKDKIV
jgi:hypothetical protein